MEVSTEAAVDVFSLPSKTESLETKSRFVADGLSSQSQVEALNDELMDDSHEDPVNSPNTLKTLPELSCGEQCLVSISSNSGNQISVPSLQLAREKLASSSSDSKLADGNVEDGEEGFGDDDDDDEKVNPRRYFHHDPYYHSMNHNQRGHFDPEFHEYNPGLPPPWIRRLRRPPGPQLWNRWDDSEKGKNQEYRLPGFMQETGPTGVGAALFNKGNTCYINAILQCFTHTVPLVQALRSCNHEMPCSAEGFCVLCVLRDHIELSLSSSGKILEPLQLVNNLNNISSNFCRYQQEDAHEFLQCLLERLERHCLDSSLTDDCASSHDKNIVEQVFGGRLVSKLRCCNCGHCSDKYEPLIDLSLEIEDADSLQSALESFTTVEKIEDSETKFTCESCKEEVSREKQLMLDKAPSVAALHLKRFKIDGTSVEKIGKHVQFPLELDLKPYTNDNKDNDQVGFKYQLYAVVVHKGYSLTSGHYFCYIRSSPDTWHKLDDSEVSKEQEEFVLSQAAYVLFYAREGTPWCSSLIKPQELCSDPSNSNTSPKSVLDNVNSECTGVENNKSSETNVIKDAIEETSFHIPCERKFEESEYKVETEGIFAQISPANGPNLHRIVSKGETHMVDVSVPLGANDHHDGVLHDGLLCFPPSVEEDNYNQGAEKIEINGDLHSPTPDRSPAQDKGLPEARHHIMQDHPKREIRLNYNRSSKKVVKDSQKAEALRCIKRMPTARGMKLMAAMLPRNDKIRPRSSPSPCKRASPPGSRRKPTIHMVVMR